MWLYWRIAAVVNGFLAIFGFSVQRSGTPVWKRSDAPVRTKVGNYEILLPPISPLVNLYRGNPDCAGQLGRLAAIMLRKYPDMAAVDVGANCGDTLSILKSAADIPVLCIEGDPGAYVFLEENARQFRSVTTHRLFLGEKSGKLAAMLDKAGWNATIVPDRTGSASILDLTSLDDFLPRQPGSEKVKLLKIDAEGFDCPIIRGGFQWIAAHRPVISFEYNRENMEPLGEKGLDTLALLEQAGYGSVVFHDFAGRFFSATTLADHALIQELHAYADGKAGRAVAYYDFTVFHAIDRDLAETFVQIEREHRAL